jgi:diaminohydroxyphosphoribosylaminopyrimidine deaminase/5-amino-6-(5-phosphoribosylamino)uracil reductase
VTRVVVAMVDPFAKVRGKGVAILRNAGREVEVGCLEAEARRVNGAFLMRLSEGRPWVIAKWAQSLDGAVATAAGESKWISGEESREIVQRLRGRVDGIVVGIGTVLADDPLLTARPARAREVRRVATRIVLDSACRLPLEGKLMRTVGEAPVMVVHGEGLGGAAERRRKRLAERGAMTVGVNDVAGLLKYLGEREYANVLVEGGPTVLAGLFAAGVVDECHIFQAGLLIPGGRRAVGGEAAARLAEAPRMEIAEIERVGADVHVTAYPVRKGRGRKK